MHDPLRCFYILARYSGPDFIFIWLLFSIFMCFTFYCRIFACLYDMLIIWGHFILLISIYKYKLSHIIHLYIQTPVSK